MRWLSRSDEPSSSGAALAGASDPHGKHNKNALPVAAILTTAFLCSPLHSLASQPGLQRMAEDDMRGVSAQGLYDRYFDHIKWYSAGGNIVEVIGNLAMLLNPVAALLDVDTTFRNARFSPASPFLITDVNGAALIRFPSNFPPIDREIVIRGSNGTSVGTITIRGLDFSGTVIKVVKR
ncbi:hypothetical protein EGT07_04850 [Herbaspirillum sp. HC18]|nr:hypothetical protein EGT07_04850 [Herbaspirillum sp. HC18]